MNAMLCTFLVALCGAAAAKRMKLPASGMTGSLLAVGIVSAATGTMHFPMSVKLFAQVITGAYIGQQISRNDIGSFKQLYQPILLLLCMLAVNTLVMGAFISWFCGIDLTTSLISCVSGGIMDMSLISIDMGADTDIVAFMQLVRLCGILLILPYWVNILCRKEEIRKEAEEVIPCEAGIHPFDSLLSRLLKNRLQKLLFTLMICGAAGYLGFLSGLPAGALTCSMIMSVILKLYTNVSVMPFKVRFFAQVLAGALVGCSFTIESIALLKTLFVPAVLLLGSYLLLNYIYARISVSCHFLDFRSSIFASSPAGATDISLIAGEFGADMPKIAVIQIVRMIFAIAVMPLIIKMITVWLS